MTRELTVSVTELEEYLRCHRAWDYQSANRQSLVSRGAPATALWVGSALHAGLAAQIDAWLDSKVPPDEDKRWIWEQVVKAVDEYIEQQRAEMSAEYVRRVGVPMSTQEWVSFEESVAMIRGVMKEYFRKWGLGNTFADLGLTPLASELTMRIPIDLDLPGVHATLVGTVDAVLIDDEANLWIVDHKSFSQRPSLNDIQYNQQFIGYCAMVEKLVGRPVAGFVYNGINKKVPKEPRLLQNGTLSKEWIDTTEFKYRQTLQKHGLSTTNYVAHLARLRERDVHSNPFFVRYQLVIPQAMKVDWWQNMRHILREMADPGLPLTFNRQWSGCWDCNVQDLCATQMRGGNVQSLIAQGYQIGTYGTQRKLTHATPETVSSISDLVAFTSRRNR
jgi:hypothetical protein